MSGLKAAIQAKLHHVGLVVSEEKFEDVINGIWMLNIDLGDPVSKRIDEFGCDCILYGQVEIVIPDEGSKLHGWISESITPMHHIAFEVEDINKHTKELKGEGIPVLLDKAVEGVGGTLVNFIHPMYLGIMVELVQVVK